MLNSDLLKSTNGKHYKVVTLRDPFIQGSIKAETLNSSSARNFIQNLQVGTSYWKRVLQSLNVQPKINGTDAAVLDQAAQLISQGKIEIFEIKVHDDTENPPENRVIKKEGVIYRFAAASELVINPRLQSVNFTDTSSANAYLEKIDPDVKQLKTIAKELEITIPVTTAAKTSEISDAIANALAKGDVIVIEDKTSAAPPGKQAEESQNPVGNRDAKAVAAGAAAGIVANDAGAEDKEETPVCELTELKVKCKHDRKVIMKEGVADVLVLDVIASETHKKDFEKITATIKGNALCGDHVENSSSIQPAPIRTTKAAANNIYTLACEPLPGFFKSLWLPNIEPKSYKISPNAHTKFTPNAVSIRVYPKLKWSGKISYSFGEKESKRSENKGKLETTHKSSSGKFSGNLTREYDGKKVEYIGEYKTSIDEILTKLNWITQKVDDVLGYFDGGSEITLKVGWPNIEINYSSGLMEDKKSQAVVSDYEIKVGASPLIEISGSVDFFPILMKTIPASHGIYIVLDEIKKGLGNEKGFAHIEGEINLVLTVGSAVNINFVANGTNGKEDNNNKVDSSIDIKFELAGSIKAKGHVWVIKFEKSYKVGMKSGFVGKLVVDRDDTGYYWYSRFLFNGLVIYFTKYSKLEKDIDNSAKKKNKFGTAVSSQSTSEWTCIDPDPDKEAPGEISKIKTKSEISSSNKHYLFKFE